MFLVFESIASNDPRWREELVRFSNFWVFTISKVDQNFIDNYDIKIIDADIIDDETAKGSIFASAVSGKIFVAAHADNETDALAPCCDDTPCNFSGGDKKIDYLLNEEDKKNAVNFLQFLLTKYAKSHILDDIEKNNFIQEINACQSIEDCNWILYHYLDITSYNTSGPKNPKYLINWK